MNPIHTLPFISPRVIFFLTIGFYLWSHTPHNTPSLSYLFHIIIGFFQVNCLREDSGGSHFVYVYTQMPFFSRHFQRSSRFRFGLLPLLTPAATDATLPLSIFGAAFFGHDAHFTFPCILSVASHVVLSDPPPSLRIRFHVMNMHSLILEKPCSDV